MRIIRIFFTAFLACTFCNVYAEESTNKVETISQQEVIETALMWAAAEGQTANVNLLIENKADASLQDIDGDTAESFAEKKTHRNCGNAKGICR